MKKAIMKDTIAITQYNEDYPVFEDQISYFYEGLEVVILHEFIDQHDEPIYVIFSEVLEESTTVHQNLLTFLPEEE